VWLLARLPEDVRVLGDVVEPYLVFTNSHDGDGSVRVAVTPVRVVCMNTLNLALRTAARSWRAAHTGDMQAKLAAAADTLKLAARYIGTLSEEAEALADKPISRQTLIDVVETLLPMPDGAGAKKTANVSRARVELLRRYDRPDIRRFRGTAWGALNAVGDFAAHVGPVKYTPMYRENQFARIVDGHPLLDRAYDMLKAA
jgi:phage/plasmid-like protein (TIGR03299 family)